MIRMKITVSNVFGDFADGEALLRHFRRIWGIHDGFYHAWEWYDTGMAILDENHCTREEYPDVFAFADSLLDALEATEGG